MTGHHGGKKRAIRAALARLGLQARPAEVVAYLRGLGVEVSEEAVRAVGFDLLREASRAERRRAEARAPAGPAPARRFAKVPPRRGRRRG
jgi:hypothetical protein